MVNMKTWASLDEHPNKPCDRKCSNEENASAETPATKKLLSVVERYAQVLSLSINLTNSTSSKNRERLMNELTRSSILSDIKNL